jgi:hypothetical protein
MHMADVLQEYFDSRGLALRVDRALGVIRGIKILGPHSRNGREYLSDALARAVGLYEGAEVNVNHPKGHPLSAPPPPTAVETAKIDSGLVQATKTPAQKSAQSEQNKAGSK